MAPRSTLGPARHSHELVDSHNILFLIYHILLIHWNISGASLGLDQVKATPSLDQQRVEEITQSVPAGGHPQAVMTNIEELLDIRHSMKWSDS